MSLIARIWAIVIVSLALGVHAKPGDSYADIDHAARAGLAEAAACSHNTRECGGVIFPLPGGGYSYTAPVTSDKPFGVDLGPAYASAPKAVADFHVHICSPHNAPFSPFFSESDAIANQGLHTVGYMFSFCDGNIHRYDPTQDDRDDEEVDFHSGRIIYLTIGHIAGWLPPQERT